MHFSRRTFLTASALLAAGCHKGGGEKAPDASDAPGGGIDRVIAGDWRSDADRLRDPWRHPAQTLGFFGLRPAITVLEIWPGAGWYSDIIAPYLKQNGGRFIAALEPGAGGESASAQISSLYRKRLESRQRLYGDVTFSEFGPDSGPLAPANSVDLVVSFRNVHNWMAGGYAEKAFTDAFAALKLGGVMGLVEHRAPSGGVQDVLASTGYVQEAYVKELASEAGFTFDDASEINANPADDADHPFGVWTLAPTRLTAPRGSPPDPSFDRSQYDAIGESDRMTLRFVKPVA